MTRLRHSWAGILVATAGVATSVAAQLAPASHDFGESPLLADAGAIAIFTLAARSRASVDTLTATLSGPAAGEFRIWGKTCLEPAAGAECQVHVRFAPTSYGRKTATLTVSGPGGPIGTAALTGNAIYGCGPHHVRCNYAGNYSGSVRWSEYIKASHSGGGATVNTGEAVVTIRAGVASCEGSRKDSSGAPGLSVSVRVVRIRGEGIAIVEFGEGTDDDPDQPWYRVTVVCPNAGWTMTAKDLLTGEVKTTSSYTPPGPAEMGHGEVSTDKVADKGPRLILTGSTSYPHPDADPANNATGRFTLGWSLARVDQPPPGPVPPPPASPPAESARTRLGPAPAAPVRAHSHSP